MRERILGEGDIGETVCPSATLDSINKMKNKYVNIAEKYEKQFIYNEGEVGIRHEKTGSFLKLENNGDVGMFTSGEPTGIHLSNQHQSVTNYGQLINLVAPTVRISTERDGLIINNHTLNPLLYEYSDKKNPKAWSNGRRTSFTGRAHLDDLKIDCSVRWRCPGSPSLCGRDEPHRDHWVTKSIRLTPFFWTRDDEEYKDILKDIGIPL